MNIKLPSPIRACLFDLDGVLTPTAKVHAAAWKEVFDAYLKTHSRETGAPFVPFDPVGEFDEYVNGRSRIDGIRAFLAARGITLPEGDSGGSSDGTSVSDLARKKNEVFLRLLSEGHIQAFPGSVAYVRAVRDRGLKTAVVSSSRNCRAVLAATQLSGLLDTVVDGVLREEQHLAGKPAPDTYLAAASALGATAAQAAVFEDALAGVEAGRAGHFGWVLGVDRVGQAAQLRAHGANLVVKDLGDLLEAP